MAFMEFVRGDVTETVAGTYREQEVQTPASRSESLAMLIWMVQLNLQDPETIDGTTTTAHAHVAKDSKSTAISYEDADCIEQAGKVRSAGAVQGSLSEYELATGQQPVETQRHFDPPILFPRASIYFAVQGINNVNTLRLRARVGYTLERVDPGDFIAALVD